MEYGQFVTRTVRYGQFVTGHFVTRTVRYTDTSLQDTSLQDTSLHGQFVTEQVIKFVEFNS